MKAHLSGFFTWHTSLPTCPHFFQLLQALAIRLSLSSTLSHSLSLSLLLCRCQLLFCLLDVALKMFVMRRRFNTINMLTVLLAAYSYNKGATATATPHTHTHTHIQRETRLATGARWPPRPRPLCRCSRTTWQQIQKNVRMRRCQQKYQNKKNVSIASERRRSTSENDERGER